MSECECKNILYFQPQCEPTLNIEPQCGPVLNIGTQNSGQGTDDHNLLINRDLPDQHPISAITGLEEALATFVFEQGIASDEWVIEHNLNKYPSVSVVDSANNVITPEVEYIDLNNIVVRMNGATTGKAFLN